MGGGGFFDNMRDPYGGAYAHPRTQPRARYYRPRAPVYDPYGSSRVPESRFPSKAEEPVSKKTVRTIPVTDGGAPVAVPQKVSQAEVAPVAPKLESEEAAVVKPVVAKLENKEAAATKIQAVYRGYLVRKTQPVKHLRVIKKVKEELENFKRKFQETEQTKMLRSDSQERLRWTEGIMALLLRLDTLQGVHPEVRLVRKAVTKELIQFQETIDSMSTVSGGLNRSDDALIGENTDAVSHEAKEGTKTIDDGRMDVPGVENGSDDQGIKGSEDSTFDKHVPQVHLDIHEQVSGSHATNCHDESGPVPESIAEEVGFVLESTDADTEVRMDVEEQILTTVPATEEVEMEAASSQTELPPTNGESENHEAPGMVNFLVTEPLRDVITEPITKECASAAAAPAMKTNFSELRDQTRHVGRRAEEAERPALDTSHDDVDGALGASSDASPSLKEEAEAASRFTVEEDGRIILAGCTQSTSLEPLCINNLQVSQSQPSTADDINALSDRALLLQLLEENRKLKDVVGKVLHWGKHQNDVIHNLAARIEQLEERHLLHGEENKIRKIRSKSFDSCAVGDKERSLQKSDKGSRKGKF